MRVWIDLSNSPHPLLFAPIAEQLEREGDEVGITFRDHAQTRELTLERFPGARPVGSESPGSRPGKALEIGTRALALRDWARRFAPDVALSHNSYAQLIAARLAGIGAVTAMDYEHQPANHLGFRLARAVIVPECFPQRALRRAGGRKGKVVRYRGFKEQVYLSGFDPDPAAAAKLGVAGGLPLAVFRTPPSRAIYHRHDNELVLPVLRRLGELGFATVVLARHPEQVAAIRAAAPANVVIPDRAVDSRSLIRSAALFVGAGGTMTREAALIGTPAFTIFAGRPAAVDAELERIGALRRLSDPDQLELAVGADPRPADQPIADHGAEIIDLFIRTTRRLAEDRPPASV